MEQKHDINVWICTKKKCQIESFATKKHCARHWRDSSQIPPASCFVYLIWLMNNQPLCGHSNKVMLLFIAPRYLQSKNWCHTFRDPFSFKLFFPLRPYNEHVFLVWSSSLDFSSTPQPQRVFRTYSSSSCCRRLFSKTLRDDDTVKAHSRPVALCRSHQDLTFSVCLSYPAR